MVQVKQESTKSKAPKKPVTRKEIIDYINDKDNDVMYDETPPPTLWH